MVQVFTETARKQVKRPDVERTVYLGYPILVCERHLTIHTPDGEPLVSGRIEFSMAREIIRRHRLDQRLTQIAEEATT